MGAILRPVWWKTIMPRLVMKFGGTSVADLERIKNAAAKVKAEVENGYEGVSARSWQGWQVPLYTNEVHGSARIERIDTTNLIEKFGEGMHAVIAGFQGIAPDGRIATLGRGGSDTSAVAFAAALEAERCDIYTDVDGVYTTDPRISAKARKLDKIAFEEMLELASLGAPGIAAAIFGPLAEANVNVDMIVQNISEDGRTDMTFSCPVGDLPKARKAMEAAKADGVVNFREMLADDAVAKVSIVGIGMRSHTGVAQQMFKALSDEGINIRVITTSEIKVPALSPVYC